MLSPKSALRHQLGRTKHMVAKTQTIFNEINITPLTDIFLVLLIIMMVVAPMMQSFRGDISPPSLKSGQPVEQGKLTVEITKDGQFFMEGQSVAPEQLTERLRAEADKRKMTDKDRNVVVRADSATRSGEVIRVFEAARDAAFVKVTVAGAKGGMQTPEPTPDDAQQPAAF